MSGEDIATGCSVKKFVRSWCHQCSQTFLFCCTSRFLWPASQREGKNLSVCFLCKCVMCQGWRFSSFPAVRETEKTEKNSIRMEYSYYQRTKRCTFFIFNKNTSLKYLLFISHIFCLIAIKYWIFPDEPIIHMTCFITSKCCALYLNQCISLSLKALEVVFWYVQECTNIYIIQFIHTR